MNTARLQDKVRALYGSAGNNPVPLITDLIPTTVIEADRFEWRFSGREFSFMVRENLLAGGAANFSVHALLNPLASGVIAVVEMGSVSAPVEYTFTLEATVLATFTAGTTPQPRDFRQRTPAGAAQLSALTSWTRNNAPGFGGLGYRQHQVTARPPFEILISPGTALVVQAVTVNTALESSLGWRERPQEQGVGT